VIMYGSATFYLSVLVAHLETLFYCSSTRAFALPCASLLLPHCDNRQHLWSTAGTVGNWCGRGTAQLPLQHALVILVSVMTGATAAAAGGP